MSISTNFGIKMHPSRLTPSGRLTTRLIINGAPGNSVVFQEPGMTGTVEDGSNNDVIMPGDHVEFSEEFSQIGEAVDAIVDAHFRQLVLRQRAINLLDVWAIFLPQRILKEELGDYLEDISRRAAEGQSRWLVYGRVFTAIVYTAINTFRYLRKELGIKLAGSKS